MRRHPIGSPDGAVVGGDADLHGAVGGGHAHQDDGSGGPEGWPDPGGLGRGSSSGDGGLATRLRQAINLLPPPLGAPVELLELGRTTRTIPPGLRRALAARDGGCAAPGCDRPPAWTDAHHLQHWADGGPTDLSNLVLLCRTTTWPCTRAAGASGGTRPAASPP